MHGCGDLPLSGKHCRYPTINSGRFSRRAFGSPQNDDCFIADADIALFCYKVLKVFKVIKGFWAFLRDNATYGTRLSTDTTTFRD